MSRARKAIRREDYLAAALACLLPQKRRDELRAAKVPAQEVIRLFSPDHVVLHAHDGSDAWWNLHPRLRPEHKEKSRRDTAIAAKIKRIASFMAVVEALDRQMACPKPRKAASKLLGAARCHTKASAKNARTGSPRVKRKIASRPFPPRGSRPFRSRPK